MIKILTHEWVWPRKKWETSFYMCASLYKTNSCNGILKNIVGYNVFIPTHAPKQVDTKMINGMFTLITWKNCAIIECGKPRQVCNVVKKWTKDKQNVGVVGWANNQVTTIGPI